jgi:hypothetical protein
MIDRHDIAHIFVFFEQIIPRNHLIFFVQVLPQNSKDRDCSISAIAVTAINTGIQGSSRVSGLEADASI